MSLSKLVALLSILVAIPVSLAQKPVDEPHVPTAPPLNGQDKVFKDSRYNVTFRVPPGWELSKKDGEVSTFHMDARSAPPDAILRGVATIAFNPYPTTTLSGAMFYYSVEPKTTDEQCARQASAKQRDGKQEGRAVQDIAGMPFTHGHDEYGNICVESRDEIYTAYRKGACYRFDLTLTTFCSVSSGVRDMNRNEMIEVEQKLANILSTVELGWQKSGSHPVPVPELQAPTAARTPMTTTKPGS